MKNFLYTLIIASIAFVNCFANKNCNLSEYNLKPLQNKLATLENQIITEYKKTELNPESSEKFAKIFQKTIQENPETLNYPFKKLLEETNIYISTSSDGRLRFYSWDNHSGGTMRFFDQIIQFADNGKVIVTLKIATDDSQSFISKIYSMKTNKNETIYFTINNSILSSSLVMQSIFSYTINKNKLNTTKIFKTKKQFLSAINCEFDFFSVVDRPERPVELIKIKNKRLQIPLINEKGTVTNKNLIYKWNGSYFIYEGIK